MKKKKKNIISSCGEIDEKGLLFSFEEFVACSVTAECRVDLIEPIRKNRFSHIPISRVFQFSLASKMADEPKIDSIEAVLNDENIYPALINHIFLPKNLPGEQAENFDEHEFCLLLLMNDIVSNFGKIVPKSTKKLFETMYDIESVDDLKTKKIAKAINHLKPGEMFAFYIRAQNCGFSLYVPEDESNRPKEEILSTFEVSMRNETVYSNSSDIQVSTSL